MIVLEYLFGSNPKNSTLLLSALAGLGTGISFYFVGSSVSSSILAFMIGVDIGAGIISNFSQSTRQFYSSKSLGYRILFPVMHFIQPVLFDYFVTTDETLANDTVNHGWCVMVYAIMLVFSLPLVFNSKQLSKDNRFSLAALGYITGVGAASFFSKEVVLFSSLYYVKLIFAYSLGQSE
jgi:uncharacterized membrane protein YbjE (DUF340 family)